jgi:single-stranded-DNA-specific exonuclease
MEKTILLLRPLSDDRLPDALHPVLKRVYRARGISCSDELDYSLKRLLPFTALSGIDTAVRLLAACIEARHSILVVGDFDADGATSCALAVLGLRALSAAQVGYLVPNRFEFGYGLTPEIVALAAHRHPALLITVDNGIASIEGVAAAKRLGMQVIVTDHHLPGATLPAADAIVNPNLQNDPFPSKHLAGVGVMFYVLLALRAYLREHAWHQRAGIAEPNLAEWLDLVAVGTVADVVPLDGNNRILVHQGLARIRAGRCRPGLTAIIEQARRDRTRLTAADLGFAVAPRLNAAGRLTDMSLGIECLLCDDQRQAREMAATLDELNRQRRELEATMQEQALAYLAEFAPERGCDGALPNGLCLYDEAWHQGIIGILAGRIRERVHRPVIAFAPASDGELKGSARSIPEVHIRDALAAIATARPGLIQRFGGHAMAAGLSLRLQDLAEFQQAFADEVARWIEPEALRGVIHSDGELDAGEFSLDLAETLRNAGPWGQGFAEPIFDGDFQVLERRILGERHLKLRVCPPGGETLDAMLFNAAADHDIERGETVRLAYRLDVNEYQGRRRPQLIIEHALRLNAVI